MQKTKKVSKIKAKQFIIEQVFLYQIKEPQHDLLEMSIDKYMVQNRQEEEVEINLLFQYPDSIGQIQVENNIKMTVDSLKLWGQFTEEEPDEDKFQIVYTKHSVHLNKLVKNNIYLLIVLRISLDNILYKTYKTIESENIPYIKNSYFLGKNLQLKEFVLENFLKHFCSQFQLFYSGFDSLVDEDSVTESNKMLFKSFIRNYSKLYAEDQNKINIMRYFYQMMIYAPVNKTQFMALNYLTKIIRTLDTQILDYMIFYHGYFIYSTMTHKISQLFFDYLYLGKSSMKQSNDKLSKRFGNALEIKGRIDFPYGLINHVISDLGGFLFGPKAENKLGNYKIVLQKNRNQQYFSADDVFFPTVYIPQEDGTQLKRKIMAYLEKDVNVLFFYNHDIKLSKNSFHSIQQAIHKNIETIQKNLEKDFVVFNKSQNLFKLIYYNNMNLAFKSTPEDLLERLDTVTLELVTELKADLISDPEIDDITSRTEQFWIYGFRSNKRIIFLFFDGILTLTKFTAEQKEVKNLYFSQVFI